MEKDKKKLITNIEIIGLSIIGMIVLIIYMVFIKKDDNEGINNNNSEVSFDYNEIEKELTSELNNKTIYLESCDCSKVLDYDSVNKAKCSKKIISNDTISTFINKLKTANKIELISTSKACSEYTYSVLFDITPELDMTDGEITFTLSNIKDDAGHNTEALLKPTNGHKI